MLAGVDRPTLYRIVLGGLLALAVAPAAHAQPAPARTPFTFDFDDEIPTHVHGGLAVRIGLGPGAVASWTKYRERWLRLAGAGINARLSIGWAVSPRLVVQVESALVGTFRVRVTQGGDTETVDEAFAVIQTGLGVAYYVMPLNAYVSGTLGLSRLSLSAQDEVVAETDDGPGLTLSVGKEWWLTRSLAAGGSFSVLIGREPERDESTTWTTLGLGLAVTASYN